MENILKVFLMAFPEWLACIFMVVGLVVTALAAVRLGYGLVVAKTVYKWIVNAEEKFGSGAGAEKKAHVIAVLRGYTPDWLDWAINERTLDWIVQLVFDFTKKKLEDYMAKKSAETTTVAHFGETWGRTSVMTDEELEHRLTAVENRAQSNTHRLDELGKLTDAVNGMNTNIKLTIQQLETTNRSLEVVTAQNKKQDDRLTALEKAPGVFGNKLWWAVIAAVIAGFVASELARYLH